MAAEGNTIELPGMPGLHFHRSAEACLDYPVKSVTVVIGNDLSLTHCNHWRFFVTFSLYESVALDMVVANDSKDLKGYCGAVRKNYDITSEFFKCIPMSLRPEPITLRDLVLALNDAGCFRYKYPSPNDGCRFWAGVAVVALEKAQLFTPPSAEAVSAEMNYTWTSRTSKQRVPAEQGTFY